MLTGQADDGWVGIYLQDYNIADPKLHHLESDSQTCFEPQSQKAGTLKKMN
jgi:hypothetical protein